MNPRRLFFITFLVFSMQATEESLSSYDHDLNTMIPFRVHANEFINRRRAIQFETETDSTNTLFINAARMGAVLTGACLAGSIYNGNLIYGAAFSAACFFGIPVGVLCENYALYLRFSGQMPSGRGLALNRHQVVEVLKRVACISNRSERIYDEEETIGDHEA